MMRKTEHVVTAKSWRCTTSLVFQSLYHCQHFLKCKIRDNFQKPLRGSWLFVRGLWQLRHGWLSSILTNLDPVDVHASMHHTTGPIALNGLMESQSKAFQTFIKVRSDEKNYMPVTSLIPKIYFNCNVKEITESFFDHLLSVSRLSIRLLHVLVNFSHFNHLLQNHWFKIYQTWQNTSSAHRWREFEFIQMKA